MKVVQGGKEKIVPIWQMWNSAADMVTGDYGRIDGCYYIQHLYSANGIKIEHGPFNHNGNQ